MVMKLGTIVFYQRYDDFLTILKNANVKEVSLALDDEIFHKFCGQAKTTHPSKAVSVKPFVGLPLW